MDTTDPKTRFYRWVVLGCAFTVLSISNGMIIAGPSVFDALIIAELSGIAGVDITVRDLKIRDAIHMLVTLGLGFFAGTLADRVGVKPIILFGLALLSACSYLYGQVQNLVQIYWIHVGFGVVLSACGLIVNVMLVAKWFTRNRGLAMGLVLAGSSIGNALMPQINVLLLETFASWRLAFSASAIVPLGALALAVVFLRSSPGQDDPDPLDNRDSVQAGGFTIIEALGSRNFWVLGAVAFGTFFSILAMSSNSVLYLQSQGLSIRQAAFGPTVLFIGGLVGKLISGQAAESLGHKRVLLTGVLLMLCGLVAMLSGTVADNLGITWTGLSIFGFGWGGLYTLIQLLVAEMFGLIAIGKILGALYIVETLGGALGPVVTGALFDATGDWILPLAVMSLLLLTALSSSLFLRVHGR